jgi:hypothetical protein
MRLYSRSRGVETYAIELALGIFGKNRMQRDVREGEECLRFSKAIARRVKYPIQTPRRLMTVLRMPKAIAIEVSGDTWMTVSQGILICQ